jgi:uncharacterized DUF497 family protein
VDVVFSIGSQRFVWDQAKASSNLRKHGVPFETAAEVLLDPLAYIGAATEGDEARQAAVGFTRGRKLLFVVHLILEEEVVRIIFAHVATSQERNTYENNA